MYRCGFDNGVLVQVVADLCSRDLHHLVDEHVVVAAGKVDQVSEAANRKEQFFFVGEAGGRCHQRVAKAKTGRFHGSVSERFELLVQMGERSASIILFGALHYANAVDKAARHGGNPAFARNAVGIHRQEHFVLCNLEGTLEGAFFGACNLRKILRERQHLKPGVRGGEFFEDFLGGIGGAVIDADYFPFANIVLFGEGFERTLREFFFVSHGNDYRYARGRLGTLVTVRADESYDKE